MKPRREKVKGKREKESIRQGTKHRKEAIITQELPEVSPFINTIIIGDAKEVLQAIPDDAIDMVVTSPPYNFGLEYADDPAKDTQRWDTYFERLYGVWQECYRVLKPGGRIAVNVQPLFSDYIPTHHVISNQLLGLGFLWKAEILWEKSNYNAKYTAWGSWKSPSMPYLKYTWEFVEVFDKITHKKAGKRELIDITGDEFKEWVYGRWAIAPESRMQEYGHPAMFPEELVYRLLRLFTYRGDIVLDPFNGAGTTTAVACRLRRRFVGVDISPSYCETALERIRAKAVQETFLETPLPYEYPKARLVAWEDFPGETSGLGQTPNELLQRKGGFLEHFKRILRARQARRPETP
jgi:DNA modification methylase